MWRIDQCSSVERLQPLDSPSSPLLVKPRRLIAASVLPGAYMLSVAAPNSSADHELHVMIGTHGDRNFMIVGVLADGAASGAGIPVRQRRE
jgi:hypothetical protein